TERGLRSMAGFNFRGIVGGLLASLLSCLARGGLSLRGNDSEPVFPGHRMIVFGDRVFLIFLASICASAICRPPRPRPVAEAKKSQPGHCPAGLPGAVPSRYFLNRNGFSYAVAGPGVQLRGSLDGKVNALGGAAPLLGEPVVSEPGRALGVEQF